ncbi:MAG: methionine--tRNA ligase [Candidatus Pacebacteria bacterium]|nr:methionine--tRNA ligase [Candidatus Paceibacterota bacterium]
MHKSFYLTTTLPYVNAPLHMGHALEFVRADILARYKTLMGYDVYFNTGTDEHGVKIYDKAQSEGVDVQTFVDSGFATFKEQLQQFGIMDTIHFVRTTDAHHIEIAKAFWNRALENGYIYKAPYQAKYCKGCESEKTDSELVNEECPEHPGQPLQHIDEENYFFKYSAFTEKLIEFYNQHPMFVVPDFRFKEIKEFVGRGLQDFSISRKKEKMPWGIPVPNDDDHVMYVWFDALTNYVSTLGNPFSNDDKFNHYWVNGTPTQYCGKDNNRFQSAMWQAMLMAVGLPNSHQIIINGFITGDGGIRMSKTLGNVVDPRDMVSEYGTDTLRLFLTKEISTWDDSPFTVERFSDAYHSNLVNGLGNLVSRTLTMAQSYDVDCSGLVFPEFSTVANPAYETFDYTEVTNDIWHAITALDKLITEREPFKVFKINPDQARNDVFEVLQGLAKISVQLQPIMPETAQKMRMLIEKREKPAEPLFARKV